MIERQSENRFPVENILNREIIEEVKFKILKVPSKYGEGVAEL
jgi:hypothetical protein